MTQQLAEIDAIANDPAPATVANTLEALERSGAVLRRATKVFQNLAGTDSNVAMRAIQSQIAPKLAAHLDAILLNPKLFERVNALGAADDIAAKIRQECATAEMVVVEGI